MPRALRRSQVRPFPLDVPTPSKKEGNLSAQEAARLPAIDQRFKQMGVGEDGSLSRTEFEKGANSCPLAF